MSEALELFSGIRSASLGVLGDVRVRIPTETLPTIIQKLVQKQLMKKQEELEKLPTTQLAVMCSRVADDSENYSEAGAEKALKLKTEWASLQTPPDLSVKDQQAKEAELSKLHNRMAEFLAGIL